MSVRSFYTRMIHSTATPNTTLCPHSPSWIRLNSETNTYHQNPPFSPSSDPPLHLLHMVHRHLLLLHGGRVLRRDRLELVAGPPCTEGCPPSAGPPESRQYVFSPIPHSSRLRWLHNPQTADDYPYAYHELGVAAISANL